MSPLSIDSGVCACTARQTTAADFRGDKPPPRLVRQWEEEEVPASSVECEALAATIEQEIELMEDVDQDAVRR